MLDVKFYGAIGDGSTHPLSERYSTLESAQLDFPFATSLSQEQDWAGIQKAINLARREMLNSTHLVGEQVYIPPGKYQLKDSLLLKDVYGLEVVGEGRATSLWWSGSPAGNVVQMENCSACHLRNLWFMFNSPADVVVNVVRGANTNTWIPGSCVFEDLNVGGFSTGNFRRGFSINGDGPGGDQNNELHRWKRVAVFGYTESAFHIKAGQVHGLVFEDCEMLGSANAPYGVFAEYGGFLHWLRGSGGYHTNCDFFLRDFLTLSTIQGWNSEQSARLLQVWEGANCNATPVLVQGCRWDGIGEEPFIANYSAGLLNIQSNQFRSTAGHKLRIAVGTFESCGRGSIIHIGNVYYDGPALDGGALQISSKVVAHDFGNLYANPAEGNWDCQTAGAAHRLGSKRVIPPGTEEEIEVKDWNGEFVGTFPLTPPS